MRLTFNHIFNLRSYFKKKKVKSFRHIYVGHRIAVFGKVVLKRSRPMGPRSLVLGMISPYLSCERLSELSYSASELYLRALQGYPSVESSLLMQC